jgi:hypothetical protein
MRSFRLILLALILLPVVTEAQFSGDSSRPSRRGDIPGICQKCGTDEEPAAAWLLPAAKGWGFGYDSLLAYMNIWRKNPYVTIDSLGASVNNRGIFELTITDSSGSSAPRRTVYIHARTHPGEVQAFWVANAMIDYLLSDRDYARLLRQRLTFHIVPMYNPDGVELESARWNAHGVDLEREWDKESPEPEVVALKRRFIGLMDSPAPIEIALNLHSSSLCERYFVVHHEKGTSPEYVDLERKFVDGVQTHFTTGMQLWDYNITWDTGTPRVFPESWWWRTHGTSVLALTYEDMNCTGAGEYDSTGYAILHGIGDYLGVMIPSGIAGAKELHNELRLQGAYPNPFTSSTSIRYSLPRAEHVTLRIVDLLGRAVETLVDEEQTAGTHDARWNSREELPGIYLCYLKAGDVVRSMTLRLVR